MAATWTCPHCHADVLGSSCECEGYDAGKIAQLEAENARLKYTVKDYDDMYDAVLKILGGDGV